MRKFILGILSLALMTNVHAAAVQQAHTTVDVVTAHQSVTPGQTFWVGIHMILEDHWHVYWRNPGDSGLPPKIEWQLPLGVTVGEMQWPAPIKLVDAGLATFGHEREVLFLMPVTVDPRVPLGVLNLQAKVSWLACKDICVPGRADFILDVPVDTTERVDSVQAQRFEETMEQWPVYPQNAEVFVYDEGQEYVVVIADDSAEPPFLKEATFFPYRDDVIDQAAAQPLELMEGVAKLHLKKIVPAPDDLDDLQGVLVTNKHIWKISSSIVEEDALMPPLVLMDQKGEAPLGILFALVFAFIGGMILNLMPCVLPVLSIKVLSFVQHAGNPKKAWRSALLFMFGVLVSFWILAGLLLILRFAGQQIGWGFQFQSPIFLIVLATILFLFGLNLLGVFEVGTSAVLLGGRFLPSGGWQASFMSGVLATTLATPCTAPFMGSALGYAITQPPQVALLIFTFLGLGMSFPYLILARFPALLAFVPKPGPWMNTFRKWLSILLFATVAWLGWVLYLQVGSHAPMATHAQAQHGIAWQKYSPELMEDLRAQGQLIFLDFTAAWCLTCQVNDRVTLRNQRVIDAFNESDIVPVKADWTNYDPQITQALSEFGKNSIPFYVVYDRQGNVHTLPELITPEIVLDYLKKVRATGQSPVHNQ